MPQIPTRSIAQFIERWAASEANERAAEEARGLIRWLRPDFQRPAASQPATARPTQQDLELPADELPADAAPPAPPPRTGAAGRAPPKLPWPADQADRTKAIQQALAACTTPVTPEDLARRFLRARSAQVSEILEALSSLGLARRLRGKYLPV